MTPPKLSYRWTDRAVRLVEALLIIEATPPSIQRRAEDAVQHFVWATDCRRQANNTTYCENPTPGWGAKADKAHRAGKKAFNEAQKWLDAWRASKEQK